MPTTIGAKELVERFEVGERDFAGMSLKGGVLRDLDLRGADFTGSDLRGADLSGARLEGVSFDEAQLSGVELTGARYDGETLWPEGFDHTHCGAMGPGADLEGASIRAADLSGSDLSGVNFQWADLQRTDLHRASLRGASLKGADLSGANLDWVDLGGASLLDVDLRGARLEGADLTGARLEGADLRGARYNGETLWPSEVERGGLGALGPWSVLKGAELAWSDLQRADLRSSDLTGADLKGADLRRAMLWSAVLVGADLTQARLAGAALNDTDLSGANLAGVELSGARYDKDTRWPEGFDFAASGAIGPGARFDQKRLGPAIVAAEADLSGASFRRARLKNTGFRGADLRGADFSGAVLLGVDLTRASLEGARFEGTTFQDVKLLGARYDAETLWPANFDHTTQGAVGPGADLRRAELCGVDLRGVDLFGAQLDGIDLRGARYDSETLWPTGFDYARSGALGPGAILAGATLQNAWLFKAQLQGTDLQRASLERANLAGAQLRRASLRGANLQWANLKGADLGGADLIGARLEGACYDSQTVWPAGFDLTSRGALGPGTRLAEADLAGLNLSSTDLKKARLAGAELQWTNLRGADLAEAALSGADLSWANLTEAVLTSADLAGACLKGAALSGANLSGARLEGAELSGASFDAATRWPEGFDFAHCGALGPGAVLEGGGIPRDRYNREPMWPLSESAGDPSDSLRLGRATPAADAPLGKRWAESLRFPARPSLPQAPNRPVQDPRQTALDTLALAMTLQDGPGTVALTGSSGSGRSHALAQVRAWLQHRLVDASVPTEAVVGHVYPIVIKADEIASGDIWRNLLSAIFRGLDRAMEAEVRTARPRLALAATAERALWHSLSSLSEAETAEELSLEAEVARLEGERDVILADLGDVRFGAVWDRKAGAISSQPQLAAPLKRALAMRFQHGTPVNTLTIALGPLVASLGLLAVVVLVFGGMALSGALLLSKPLWSAVTVLGAAALCAGIVQIIAVRWARVFAGMSALEQALDEARTATDDGLQGLAEPFKGTYQRRLEENGAATDAVRAELSKRRKARGPDVNALSALLDALVRDDVGLSPVEIDSALVEFERLLLAHEGEETGLSERRQRAFPLGSPRLALLVDDLDRCAPEPLHAILTALHKLVRSPLFCAVLACEPDHVESALVSHNGGVRSSLYGDLVDLSYALPSVSPGVALASLALKDPFDEASATRTTGEITIGGAFQTTVDDLTLTTAQTHSMEEVGAVLSLSPRELRRTRTAFLILRMMAKSRMGAETASSALTATESRFCIAMLGAVHRSPSLLAHMRDAIESDPPEPKSDVLPWLMSLPTPEMAHVEVIEAVESMLEGTRGSALNKGLVDTLCRLSG